jgi:TolB-like protein/cytochrome c-type biogenesis protein CcmH/NrfG
MAEERARRRLAAILAADVVGYSRLTEQDEAGTLAALKIRRSEVLQPLVSGHHGRIVKFMGDGVLVEFASAVDAVECAVQLQQGMEAGNADLPEDRRIRLRIGVNLGDVLVEGSDIYGDGVNIAARLEAFADPGSVIISQTVFSHIRGKVKVGFDDLGEQRFKNIDQPVQVYRVQFGARTAEPNPSIPDKPSIAVLPFANMSGDPEQEYFCDGLTEDIITELSRFRQLLVIARNSSFQYRGKNVDVKRIGRELSVRYLVEGSIRRVADRARITAQLIDAALGNHLWADRYDRNLQDVFAVQDEVTRTIVATLAIRLEDEGLTVAKRKLPGSMDAYDHWLRGKKCLDRWTRQANEEARFFFEKAIELDPSYARAHSGLALTYEWAHYYSAWGGDNVALRQRAEDLAQEAARLDPTDHVPHLTLAWIHHERRDFQRARRYLDQAEALNPNDADMLIAKAMILSSYGEPEAALELARSAIRLNPRHPDYYLAYTAHCYLIARRYEEAKALSEGLVSVLPEGRALLAVICARLGNLPEARSHIQKFIADFSNYWIEPPSASFVINHLFHYKHKADADMVVDSLVQAGMPA